MSDIVQKLWGFCHTLRHDGIDYGDYIEQITFLLFLKMAHERAIDLPKGCDWPNLRDESGSRLTDLYADLLRKLGRTEGILGDIYAEAQSRFNNPVNLKKLINLIDETEWTTLGVDVKAEAYEGLLGKSGQRRQERGRAVFHAPRAHPSDRALHEARSPRPQGVYRQRSGGRHGRFSRLLLRMADAPNQGRRAGTRRCQASAAENLLRSGFGRPAAAAGADESLLARLGANDCARRYDL